MLTLQLLYILLACSDIIITRVVLAARGINAELNGVVRWLCKRLGLMLGILLGVAIPTSIILVLAGHFRLHDVLAVLVGMRLALLFKQVTVHKALLASTFKIPSGTNGRN